MVGLFQVLGVVTGTALATIGTRTRRLHAADDRARRHRARDDAVAVLPARGGPAAKDRRGRSWRPIAGEAWGTDILRERSFVFLVWSRFFILGGSAFLIVLSRPYLERALGLVDADDRAIWLLGVTIVVAACTAVATMPAARLSERVGRKPVIYAACVIGAVGMTICAAGAVDPGRSSLGAILVGVGGGSFLAVDWALMTDIIPKASSGRYMGISNVATATNGVVAAFIGGFIVDRAGRVREPELGPRLAFLLAPVWFAIGALLLRPVDQRRREDVPLPDLVVTAPAA